MAIERITVKLPEGFDPSKHGNSLVTKVNEAHEGGGFELESVHLDEGEATLTRQAAVTEVSKRQLSGRTNFEVKLPRGTKPADGPKMAARFEDQYGEQGYYMTRFEPFLGIAELTRLDPDTVRCRGAAALALGCKEWDVQVSPRDDGGFDLVLPKTYVPSKHDGRLIEVAEAVVGSVGWYWTSDPKRLTGSIIPSEPPTFPAMLPYPMAELRRKDWHFTPFGRVLPLPGEELGPEIGIDWRSAAFGMIAGMPGAGKSVTLNDIIASALANGVELAILDVPAKAVDFLWCKKYVRTSGWGCDSLAAAVTVLAMIYEEGSRRAKVLADEGENNWLDLPPDKQFTPILIIVDEVSGLLTTEKAPSGIPKTHPLVVEAQQHNLLVATLEKFIRLITAELRFVGVRMILSTQVTNAGTGIGPSLKTKLGHKILAGSNPSETARKQAFNDPSGVPLVPENVRSDSKAARGSGACELEGTPPAVFKSYFATTTDFDEALKTFGVRVNHVPEPTPSQIAKHTPSIEDSAEDRAGDASDDYGYDSSPRRSGGREAVYSEDGTRLTGAAAANHQHKVQMAQLDKDERAKAAVGAPTVTRGRPMDPAGLGTDNDTDF